MSSGASTAYAKPRDGSSICSEDRPRSSSTACTRGRPRRASTSGSSSYTASTRVMRSAKGEAVLPASSKACGSRSSPTRWACGHAVQQRLRVAPEAERAVDQDGPRARPPAGRPPPARAPAAPRSRPASPEDGARRRVHPSHLISAQMMAVAQTEPANEKAATERPSRASCRIRRPSVLRWSVVGWLDKCRPFVRMPWRDCWWPGFAFSCCSGRCR